VVPVGSVALVVTPGYSGPVAQVESAAPAAAAGLMRVVMAETVVPAVPAGRYTAAVARAAVVVTVEPPTSPEAATAVTAVTAGLLDWPAMAERAVQAVTLEGEPPMTGLPVPVVSAGASSASPGRRDKPVPTRAHFPVGDPPPPFLDGAKKSACLAPR
jgi:hypothetical protein